MMKGKLAITEGRINVSGYNRGPQRLAIPAESDELLDCAQMWITIVLLQNAVARHIMESPSLWGFNEETFDQTTVKILLSDFSWGVLSTTPDCATQRKEQRKERM